MLKISRSDDFKENCFSVKQVKPNTAECTFQRIARSFIQFGMICLFLRAIFICTRFTFDSSFCLAACVRVRDFSFRRLSVRCCNSIFFSPFYCKVETIRKCVSRKVAKQYDDNNELWNESKSVYPMINKLINCRWVCSGRCTRANTI